MKTNNTRLAALMATSALAALSLVVVIDGAAAKPAKTTQGAPETAAPHGQWQPIGGGVVVMPSQGAVRKVRLVVMTPTIFRVIASATADGEPAASVAVKAAPDPGVQYFVSEKNGTLSVKTAKATTEIALTTGKVTVRDADGRVLLNGQDGGQFAPVKVDGQDFYAVRQEFNRGTDEGFFGLGQHQNGQMNYNGQDVILAQHNMDIAIPFVVSTRHYGVLWDNPSLTRFGYPKEYATLSAELHLRDASGKEGGLTARYYDGDTLVAERVENDPNYQFIEDTKNFPPAVANPKKVPVPNGEPMPVSENLKVVYEGTITPDKDGLHKFRFYVGGYFKLWIDDKLVIDSWRQGWQAWYQNVDLEMRAHKARKFRAQWMPDGASYLRFLHRDPVAENERHALSLASDVAKSIDYYVVVGDSMDAVVAGYRHLTGPAKMMPKWAYGYWQSRQRYATQDQLVGTVERYRALKLPLDAVVQDWRFWKDPEWGSHDFDPARYRDPKKMIADVHAMNAHFMMDLWPKFNVGIANYKELDDKGLIYRRAVDRGYIDWVKPGYVSSYYDAYSPEARAIYWAQVRPKLDVLKPDSWWMDNDEPDIHSNMSIEERIRMMGPTAIGPGAQYFNSYPLVHVCGFYENWKKAHPDERTLILTRSAFAGIQNCAAMAWSGDTASRWDVFRDQISAGVNFSMSGVPNWSFDIGGFTPEKRYGGHLDPNTDVYTPAASAEDDAEWAELYTRWFQFGAFAPIFRSHGENRRREIYEVAAEGTEVYDTLVHYDSLRYRLMPYIYSLAGASYHESGTIMRGLAMDFTADRKAWNVADEYMFGPAILVAPVTQYKARSRSVYLPAGTTWYDFYTGVAQKGGRSIDAKAPLNRIPLFVPAGAIIPSGVFMQYVDQITDGPILLSVFTGKDGAFDLYEDDGKSEGYAKGEFARIPIRYDDKRGTLSIGARLGSFPGMVARRTVKVRWVSGPRADLSDFDAQGNVKSDASAVYDGSALVLRRPSAH